jgi:hypothetical protein
MPESSADPELENETARGASPEVVLAEITAVGGDTNPGSATVPLRIYCPRLA